MSRQREEKMVEPPALRDHPQRRILSAEVHARPYMRLLAPARASLLALYTEEEGAEEERRLLTELCRSRGAAGPGEEANFHLVELEDFTLRWERHTEFSTYGFFAPAEGGGFEHKAIERLPQSWLARLPGEVLCGVHLELQKATGARPEAEEVAALLQSDTFAACRAAGGAAEVWMNFTINEDGFGRLLVRDRHLGERQAGRLVQRLFEIETYRMMALLALPLARRHGRELTLIGAQLTSVTEAMAGASVEAAAGEMPATDGDRQLLEQLTAVAADTQRIAAATAYRFSAARAYYALVQRRIEELREERIEGHQTVREFMDRRLSPAMRTCEAVAERIEVLSRQIARTAQLLRTRIDVQLAAQNRDLLLSMDRRVKLQLILQETVEGLSVAAITYYSIGLLSYALSAAEKLGLGVPTKLSAGLAIPLVAGLVWYGIRRVRRRIARWARD